MPAAFCHPSGCASFLGLRALKWAMRNAMGADKVRGGRQAEVTRLRRERAELEDRAEEAEGGLAAAQADMETGRKRLEQELATMRTEARRTTEEARLEHSSEVWLLLISRLAGEVR